MSIPVYEACGHQIRMVTPSKAKHLLATNHHTENGQTHVRRKDADNFDQGLIMDKCLQYIEVPYDVLVATLSRTHAPTRRRVHPWVDKTVVDDLRAARMVQPSAVDDHHFSLTDHGITVLQSTYAKLLHRDLERGFELVAVLADAMRGELLELRHAASGHNADIEAAPWTAVASEALQRVETRWPGATPYFHTVPGLLVRRLIQFDPYTVERLLREG